MPINSTAPFAGTKCGRRERESRREGRREQSFRVTKDSFACRDGERHPDLPDGGALRGASSERGSWSVRHLSGLPSPGRGAPMTADVRRAPRRGTPSACASKRMHPPQAREIVAGDRGRVLRSVLRPVHVDPHYAPQAQASEVGRRQRHHGWANSGNREEPALGSLLPDVARLAACHRFRTGRWRGTSEQEGDRGLRPCEG